jgi:aspartyl protease family protein
MAPRRQHVALQRAGIGFQPPARPQAGVGTAGQASRVLRHTSATDLRHRMASIIVGALVSAGAGATEVTVAGLFPNKAVVQIDGGSLQTLSVGQKSAEGVLLVSVERDAATFEIQGKRVTAGLGHARMRSGASQAASAVLHADTRGHFITDGQINGATIRFMVDTGATHIALPASEARRLGLDYRKGRRGMTTTANGNAPVFHIKLDQVRLGNITVHDVDAVVMDTENLSQALLGMSFLNRMDMKREGYVMTLTQRF